MLGGSVHKPAQHQRETESHNQRRKLAMFFFALVILIVALLTICYIFLHQPVKDSMPEHYAQYVHNVKQRYKTHLRDVAQSFWLPADMDTFIQLSLTTSQNKLHVPIIDQFSANERIVSERSMSFDDLLSEIDASPGSRIIVHGQPGIGKTTLLQMITRSWAHDRALSSCWILLHIVLRDLVLLQHAPNLTTFLRFMGNTMLPPDIETHVLESDGNGLCFIADGLDEYPAGYEDRTNFIFSLIRAQKLPQSTVVISSRPEVASKLRDMFNKHVKILGFGDDQINEYIQAKYGEDKSFSLYLDGHPNIKHTCYIPLHLAMLVYLKDSLLENLPETETEIYEQFIFHTIIRDFCKSLTSSCSLRITLPTSLNDISKLPEVEHLLFHIANLSYIGIQKRQSIFTAVELVLQHTKSSLLVVDKMSVLQPTTYSFPHLTIQEFLAAFYFNTYLSQQEQKRVYSLRQIKLYVGLVFWKFCCGLKRNENQTTFLEFFNLLYHSWLRLRFYCAHEAQSVIASQQLINSTGGIVKFNIASYYDAASFAFVAASAAQNLREIMLNFSMFEKRSSKFLLQKLCDATTNYSQLRKVALIHVQIGSNIKCLLQKSPNLESLTVESTEWYWYELRSEYATALLLPSYGLKLLNIKHVRLNGHIIYDEEVEKLSQILRDSIFLETLSLYRNDISDKGASAIANLIKALPHLRLVDLSFNHIGGTGAALLWSQSIHKCCNLKLSYNDIGNNRPDAFISALNGTINNGYEGSKSCQLEVRLKHNRLLCSDLRDIQTLRKRLPKGLTLITGDDCIENMLYRFGYHVGKIYRLHAYDAWFQWMSYAVCTFHIFHSTKTKRWVLLYFSCCLTFSILSSFNYLVWVDYFIYLMSLLWSWIVVGRLIFCVSLKLLSKPWGWVHF